MSKYAKTDQGTPLYVITKASWGKTWDRLEQATNLAEAKRKYGWTRERYTTVSVRRATVEDAERLIRGGKS